VAQQTVPLAEQGELAAPRTWKRLRTSGVVAAAATLATAQARPAEPVEMRGTAAMAFLPGWEAPEGRVDWQPRGNQGSLEREGRGVRLG